MEGLEFGFGYFFVAIISLVHGSCIFSNWHLLPDAKAAYPRIA